MSVEKQNRRRYAGGFLYEFVRVFLFRLASRDGVFAFIIKLAIIPVGIVAVIGKSVLGDCALFKFLFQLVTHKLYNN